MKPLISVIMPVYNAEFYLAEAIESILTQTFPNFELIIINDGSKDNSLQIINNFAEQDSRIVIISRENRGLIASLNEGIEKAKGIFIARMDADDVSLPTRFEKQVMLMEQKHLDICGCHWQIMNSKNKTIDCTTVPLTQESLVAYLAYSVPFAHGSVMIRKHFLDEHNLQYGFGDAKYAEDYELWLKMYELGAVFGNVDDFLFKYRFFSQSLSQINFKNNRADAQKLGNHFIHTNITKCIESFELLLTQELSKKEQELLIILGFRLSLISKKIYFSRRAIKKIDRIYLPSFLLKSIYTVLMY